MESVGFDEPEIELAVGDEMTLHANVRPLEVANRKVTWESSDEAVVSVDATGKLKALATAMPSSRRPRYKTPRYTASAGFM